MTQPAAIVTGAAGAIGNAICARLSRAGYHVVGLDIKAPAEATSAAFVEFDLSRLAHQAEERDECRQRLREAVGSERQLKLLVNNAATQRLGATSEVSFSDWQSSLDVNVTAPFVLSQMLLDPLAEAKGVIVNIGSIHARLTKPGFVAYATTKAALEGLTRALAVDVGDRVRVNAISPAAVDTPMLRAGFTEQSTEFEDLSECHPTGRIAGSNEIAEIVLWLAEGDAVCINGSSLSADGGIGVRLHDPI